MAHNTFLGKSMIRSKNMRQKNLDAHDKLDEKKNVKNRVIDHLFSDTEKKRSFASLAIPQKYHRKLANRERKESH